MNGPDNLGLCARQDGFALLPQFAEYEINVVGLLVTLEESDLRSANRSEVNGRWRASNKKGWCGNPATWTVFQHDGPDHHGL